MHRNREFSEYLSSKCTRTHIYKYISIYRANYAHVCIHTQTEGRGEREGERQERSQRIYDKMLPMYHISYQLNSLQACTSTK